MSPRYRKRKRDKTDSKTNYDKIERKRRLREIEVSKDGENSNVTIDHQDSGNISDLCDDLQIKKIHPPKTKYAIAFGYLGTGYHGFQKQVQHKTDVMGGVNTVEGNIEDCLFKIGAIDEGFRNNMQKLQMSKSSRTDKGVHAACTYIGGRFNINLNDRNVVHNLDLEQKVDDTESKHDIDVNERTKEEVFVEKINSVLPKDIRCFKIQRVSKGFDARSMCSKRKYEYVIPEFILGKRYQFPTESHESNFRNLELFFEQNLKSSEVKLTKSSEPFYKEMGKFVQSNVDHSKLDEILKGYEGTHDFHNFTVRQKIEANTTMRYIHKISVEPDKFEELNVVKIYITGQSFLYNQIRKMISLALQVYLNIAPKFALEFSLNKSHLVNFNLAPSEGLILHHPYFDSYNLTRTNPPDVPYIQYRDIKVEVELFKDDYIYPEIKRSIQSNVWETFLDTLLKYPFYLENNVTSNGES